MPSAGVASPAAGPRGAPPGAGPHVDGASHGFGQDAQDKMTQGAETTSASQQGPGGGWRDQ